MIRLIFVVNNLKLGGAQRSLLSLLEYLDYTAVSVDLMVLDHDGLNADEIPKNVNLLPQNQIYKLFIQSEYSSVKNLINRKKYGLLIWKILAKLYGLIKSIIVYNHKFRLNNAIQYSWDFYKYFLPTVKDKYECSFGLGGISTYISIDKVNANKRVAWVHTDYKTYCETHHLLPSIDNRYFRKVNNLFVVTESNKKSLDEVFPKYSNKSVVIENIVSAEKINALANEKIDDYKFKTDRITIVTVARIEKAKALDRLPEIIYKLKSEGLCFRWYIIGDGAGRINIEEQIEKYGISDEYIILGYKNNPYPYIKSCDIFALPSLYEGKSITLEEAKVLGKSILTTNYPSSKDSINHKVNGLIAENTKLGIYDGIKELITNNELRKKFSYELEKNYSPDNSAVAKIMEIIQ